MTCVYKPWSVLQTDNQNCNSSRRRRSSGTQRVQRILAVAVAAQVLAGSLKDMGLLIVTSLICKIEIEKIKRNEPKTISFSYTSAFFASIANVLQKTYCC